jgi:hypothetical protein
MLAFPEPCLPSPSGFARRSTQTRERSQLRASRERVTSQRQMPQPNTNVGDRIRSILALKGLTLSRASQISESLYGRFSPYFVPHNFYYDLRAGNFSPRAASRAIDCRIGCAYLGRISKTSFGSRSNFRRAARSCSILLWSIPMLGFAGLKTESGRLPYLRSRLWDNC